MTDANGEWLDATEPNEGAPDNAEPGNSEYFDDDPGYRWDGYAIDDSPEPSEPSEPDYPDEWQPATEKFGTYFYPIEYGPGVWVTDHNYMIHTNQAFIPVELQDQLALPF